jgi:glucosamine--fructose-6-phosphate aminotransferase (isomerizing)
VRRETAAAPEAGDAGRVPAGTLMAGEMAEQPAILRRLIARLPEIVASVRDLVPSPLAGCVLLARGSSDNAAVLGRYLIEMTSRRPAGLAAPSLITRYRASVDYRGYLVVALSQSGETPEIVSAAETMRERGARVVAVTNEAASALAAIGDVVIHTDGGRERAVPATKTVTSQMLALVGVAAAVGELPFDPTALDALPDAIATVLGGPGCDGLAWRWSDHDRLVVVGRGMSYAAALEGALKIRETSSVFAEGISVPDLLHGPIAALGPHVPVLLVELAGPTAPDLAQLRRRLVLDGTPHATLGHDPAADLHLPAGLPEPLAVIAATVLLQQLAHSVALARGRNPDAPSGLAKITGTH